MAVYYIYTYKDLNDGTGKIDNSSLIANMNGKIGSILSDSQYVALQMCQHQVEREIKIYNALKVKYELDGNGLISNKEELINDLTNKIYGITEEDNPYEESKKVIALLVKFYDDLLKNNTNVNGKKDFELKELIYNMKNATKSYEEWYKKLNDELKQIANKNEITIKDILKISDFWNQEINTSLNKKSSTNKNPFILFEDSGQINGSLKEEQLKKAIQAYKGKKNDILGGIGEAATLFFTTIGDKKIRKEVGIEFIRHGTSRWSRNFNQRESQGYKIKFNVDEYKEEYKATVEKAIDELKNSGFVGDGFSLKTDNELKADEIFHILIGINENNEFEDIVTFGISNKTSQSEKGAIKVQTSSLKAMLDNIFRVEKTGYEKTNSIRNNIIEIMANEAGMLRWKEGGLTLDKFNQMIRTILNRYAYIWFTGGRAGMAHADFFVLSKTTKGGDKLFFIPMSIILQEISVGNDIPSPLVLSGISGQEYFFTRGNKDGQMEYLNTLSGLAKDKQMMDMANQAIENVSKAGQINVGNYKRLGILEG